MSEVVPSSSALGRAPLIDKSLPRPAPTIAYSWREYNPAAKLLYIRDHKKANAELARLGSGPQALGFDLEWKPTFFKGARENPVALVQLANDSIIFLLQITAMKEFPSKLAEILANPLIVKAGVAIHDDANKICKDWRVPLCNCVDLSLLARTVDNARWQGKYNSSLGLARLIESYEYRLMEKGKTTRSNWEAYLDATQLEYASNDAHAGFVLYKKLESMTHSLQYSPDTAWYSFNMISGQFLTSGGLRWEAKNPNYDPGPPPPPRLPRQATDAGSHIEGQSSNKPPTNQKNMKIRTDGQHPVSYQQANRSKNTVRSRPIRDPASRTGSSGSGINQFQSSKVYRPRRYNSNQHKSNAPNGLSQTSQAQLDSILPTASTGISTPFHAGANTLTPTTKIRSSAAS